MLKQEMCADISTLDIILFFDVEMDLILMVVMKNYKYIVGEMLFYSQHTHQVWAIS